MTGKRRRRLRRLVNRAVRAWSSRGGAVWLRRALWDEAMHCPECARGIERGAVAHS